MKFNKRIFYTLTAFVMTCGFFCMMLLFNEQVSFAEDIRYEFDQTDQTLYISGTGSIGPDPSLNEWAQAVQKIVIGEGITAIEDEAFLSGLVNNYNFSRVTEVIFPSTLETIGKKAFYGCKSLSEIVIPNSVDSIGVSAFGECNGLERITVPFVGASRNEKEDSLSACFGYVFASDKDIANIAEKGLLNYYATVPNSLDSVTVTGGRIYDNAFQYCLVKRIELTENVTSVGNEAFLSCSKLTDIAIFCKVRFTGEKAFYLCSALENVHIASLEQWCGIVFDEKVQDMYEGNGGNNPMCTCKHILIGGREVADIVITSDVAPYSFYECSCINSVTVKGNVGKIGEYAFARCPNIKKVYLSSDIGLRVGEDAFLFCKNVDYVKVTGNVNEIGINAFASCNAISDVDLSSTSELNVGSFAFNNCYHIKTVTLGRGVRRISEQSFSGALELSRINVSPDVEYFGKSAFAAANINNDAVLEISDLEKWCGAFFEDDDANPMTHCNKVLLNGKEIKSLVLDESIPVLKAFCLTGSCFNTVYFKNGATDVDEKALYWLTAENIYFYSDKGKFCLDYLNVTGTVYSPIKSDYVDLIERNGCDWALLPGLSGSIDTFTYTIDVPRGKLIISGSGTINAEKLKKEFADNEFIGLTNALVIESGITEVGKNAFSGNKFIKTVTLPDTIIHIGSDAFKGCDNLSGVYAESIGGWQGISFDNAFANPLCYAGALYAGGKSVESVIITTDINSCSFYNCTSLKKVSIGENVKKIGKDAFFGCTNIEDVITVNADAWYSTVFENLYSNPVLYSHKLSDISGIIENITVTGPVLPYAFYNCSGLKNVTFAVPTECGYDAFFGCIDIMSVYSESLTEWLSMDFASEYSNPLSYAKKLIIAGSEVESITVSDEIKSIKPYAFCNFAGLTNIEFNDELQTIEKGAFENCTGIKTLFFGSKLKKIAGSAFGRCYRIAEITLSSDIESIDPYAFYECTNLKRVNFDSGRELFCRRVAKNGNDLLFAADFNGAGDGLLFGSCGNGECFVSGKGSFSSDILKIPTRSPEGDIVVAIGKSTFENSEDITEVVMNDNIVTVEKYAFSGCGKLHKIKLSKNLNSIEKYAFAGCISLKEITLPDKLLQIDEGAFLGCEKLERIVVPKSVTDIGYGVFANCLSLEDITLPFIGTNRESRLHFSYVLGAGEPTDTFILPDLKHVRITDDDSIPQKAFFKCTQLETVYATAYDKTQSIGMSAFEGCTGLSKLVLSHNINFIGNRAFSNCVSLKTLDLPEYIDWYGQNVFDGCDEAIITEQYKKIAKEKENMRLLAEVSAAPIAIMLFFLLPFGKKNFIGSER